MSDEVHVVNFCVPISVHMDKHYTKDFSSNNSTVIQKQFMGTNVPIS